MHKEAFLARLDSLYEDYLSTVLRLERDRKLGDGIFGIRPGPADDPCHDRFAADLQGLLEELDSDGADSSLRREVMEKIFAAPLRSPDPKSYYWMLVAVQGLTRILIPGLSSEDADALAEKYEKDYPRRERLPVQADILKLLQQAGTGKTQHRFLFRKNK